MKAISHVLSRVSYLLFIVYITSESYSNSLSSVFARAFAVVLLLYVCVYATILQRILMMKVHYDVKVASF